ncbi:MAG: Lipid A export ATP-binding/permease protein MsbA [Candidatus Uhrbacteria bacterium GW2011_GWE2_46_68]|uniref:Lipid A export ATP-binding/permease protein MsbA n=2 Tax=Candidatus Uhriibacteriota TaxID=1752732 RepID=A0A0G1Q689_9BACT|nr:MAG: Lipid A export ATP-binding/permease protein MsbA [Candidatus Uhrbacteria bacterium GW2011_GWF2_46_218]KKU40529.1 MAG: Lipid A export ATP-binding/permease protein MsbA [Candidatus Uhrbacteria bacterium GW2011_GWE2_46_68]
MKKGERKTIHYRRIWRMVAPSLKPWRWYLFLFLFFAIFLAICAVTEPYLYGSIVDSIILSVDEHTSVFPAFQLILPLLFVWGGLVLLETGVNAFYMFLSWKFGNEILGVFLEKWYHRVLFLDMELFKGERSGELLRKFDNTWDAVWDVSFRGVRTFLEAGMRFIAALSFGLFLDWRLALVSLIPVPLSIFIGVINMRAASHQQHTASMYWEKITGHVADAFANIATVKGFSNEGRFVKIFAKLYLTSCKHQFAINRLWAIVEAGYGAIYIFGRLLLFAVGAWFVLNGSTTLGTLIMFLGFANFLFGSVQMITMAFPNLSKSLVYLDRASEYWYKIPEIREKPKAKTLTRVKGQIIFDHVTFSYKDSRRVLKDVSFQVPDGQVFAIVGESGAGKSTLAQMMLRHYDPVGGSILIDGHDLRDLTLKSLRSSVGFVMQENLLFHDTILNNIRLAKPTASMKEVEQAAKRAQAHSFIKALPKKYDSMVGERGVKLSGGEKQRIALARVLLADPPILVLDEATSALDSKTEHDLQCALKETMKGRTTLVIAHRLSTVLDADQILVMDKGRIVMRGIHKDLIKKEGLYKQYWTIQAGGYL